MNTHHKIPHTPLNKCGVRSRSIYRNGDTMRKFYDTEQNTIITIEELKTEYTQLKAENQTETENFSDYLLNCMYWNNGTLAEIK